MHDPPPPPPPLPPTKREPRHGNVREGSQAGRGVTGGWLCTRWIEKMQKSFARAAKGQLVATSYGRQVVPRSHASEPRCDSAHILTARQLHVLAITVGYPQVASHPSQNACRAHSLPLCYLPAARKHRQRDLPIPSLMLSSRCRFKLAAATPKLTRGYNVRGKAGHRATSAG